MMWLLGAVVLAAIGVVVPELLSSSDSPSMKENLQRLQERHTLLETEANKLRSELAAAGKQAVSAKEKETEFVTKIFEQRKEIDQKTQEFARAAENNKVLQERMFQMEKAAELMRQHHDKALVELKLLREQNELLRQRAVAPAVSGTRRKKPNTTAVN